MDGKGKCSTALARGYTPIFGPKRYAKAGVRPFCKRQRTKDGETRLDRPKWVGSMREGTVQEDCTIRWRVIQRTFADIDCSTYKRTVKGERVETHRGRKEAETALKAWKESLEAQAAKEWDLASRGVSPEVLRIREMSVPDMLDIYIDRKLAVGDIERSTAGSYKCSAVHVRRYFGNTKVKDVSPMVLEGFKKGLKDMGYKPSTNAKTWKVLRGAFHDLEIKHVVKSNPFHGVEKGISEGKSKMLPLSEESLSKLWKWLSESRHTPFQTTVELCLRTGIRVGEACAIRWEDCDLETGAIRIRRSIGKDSVTGKCYPKSPKSGEERNIPGSPKLRDLLRARLEVVKEDCILFDAEFSPDWYVTGDVNGEYQKPQSVSSMWIQLANRLELKNEEGRRSRLHDVRHSYASYGIASGIDVVTMASLLGHSDASITMKYYADALKKVRDSAQLRLEKAFDEVAG